MAEIAERDEIFERIRSALGARNDVMSVEDGMRIAFAIAADLALVAITLLGLTG